MKTLTQKRVNFLYRGKFKVTSGMLKSFVHIGDNAFQEFDILESIVLPDTIKSIGRFAFCNCVNLKYIVIPNSVESIESGAFMGCSSLKSIVIPDSVTYIGCDAFYGCKNLNSIIFRDKTYKKQEVNKNGKTLAYKVFRSNMTCRDFQYKAGKIYTHKGEVKLCYSGFHACLSLADVFNYYWGNLEKDIHIYEVELESVSSERRSDSKIVAKQITLKEKIC